MEGCSITKEKARGTEKAQAARDNMHKELVDVGGDVGGIDSWTGRSRRAYSSIRVRRSRRVAPAPSAGTAAPAASEATGAYLKQAGALNEYVCPLTAEIMTDPVSTLDGFTYERTVITEWLRTNDTSQSTGAKLESKRHVPNPTVRCLLRHL